MFGSYSLYGGHHGGGGSSGGGGVQSLLTQLQSCINPSSPSYDPEMRSHAALEYVSQISERLSLVQNENELSGLRVGDLCRALTTLLQDRPDAPPDLIMMSARAMCNLIEALPGAGAVLADTPNCIPQLLEKLVNITFMETAEQAVLAIQKISRERATSVLKGGGLIALLSYIDFFPTSVQRVCMQTAAALVVRVPNECMDLVLQSIPLVLQKLESKSGIEETLHTAIILYLVRVTHTFTSTAAPPPPPPSIAPPRVQFSSSSASASSARSAPSSSQPSSVSWLEKLEASGLVRAVVDLLRHALREPSLFASNAITHLLSILVSLTRKSSAISEELLDGRHNIVPLLGEVYQHILGNTSSGESSAAAASSLSSSLQLPPSSPKLFSSPSKRASQAASSTIASAPPQQLNPLLSLCSELLPDLRVRPPPPQSAAAPSSLIAPSASASLINAQNVLANAQRRLQQLERDMHGMGSSLFPGASASATSAMSAALGTSLADPSRLIALSPLPMADPTASPETPHDADALEQMETEDVLAQAAQDRRIEEGSGDEENEDENENEEEMPSNPPTAGSSANTQTHASLAMSANIAATNSAEAAAKARSSLTSSKAEFLLKNPAVLKEYIRIVLPLFIQTASISNDNHLRYKCVSGILRILCVAETESIKDSSLFPFSQLAAFTHTMLQSHEMTIIAAALQLMDLLMQKGGDVFGPQFFREGCVDTVQSIAENGLTSNSNAPSASAATSSAIASASPLQHLLLTSGSPPIPPSSMSIIQERAQTLLSTHFADTEEEGEGKVNEKEDQTMVSNSDALPSGTPSKRRRYSSCATPLFRMAQRRATELSDILTQHVQACKQLHEQGDANQSTSLDQIERDISICLTSICECLVGRSAFSIPTPAVDSSSHDTLTTHELLQSGLIDSLLAFIFDPTTDKKIVSSDSKVAEGSIDPWKPTWTESEVWQEIALQRRQRLFCHAFFGLPKSAIPITSTESEESKSMSDSATTTTADPSSQSSDSVGDLCVVKLIEALESIDSIPLRTCGLSTIQTMQMFQHALRVKLTYRPQLPEEKKVEAETKEEEDDSEMMDTKDDRISLDRAATIDTSSSASRRSTRSMTAAATPTKSASIPHLKNRSESPSATSVSSASPARAKKPGFLSSALAAVKARIGGSGSSSSGSQSTSPSSSHYPGAHSAAASSATTASSTIAANLSQLYPTRLVHIDSLANWQSIESFLNESASLVDLYEKTERVQAGLPPQKSAAEIAAAKSAGQHAEATSTSSSSSSRTSRSSTKKKKHSSKTKPVTEVDPGETAAEEEKRQVVDQKLLLDGIRQARIEAHPIRVLFRFSSKPASQPYQTYVQQQLLGRLGVASSSSISDASPTVTDTNSGEWHEFDRSQTLFQAIQQHHPFGAALKHHLDKNQSRERASTPSAPQRPFSAYEMFQSTYDLEFRLTREPKEDTTQTSANGSTKSSHRRLLSNNTNRSRAGSRASSPHRRKMSISEEQKVSLNDDEEDEMPKNRAQLATERLTQQVCEVVQPHNKHVSTLSSLLLLIDSFHHLSHHWSTLYSAWPEMIDFFSANDSCGNGTTGRNINLPPSVIASGAASVRSHLPYSHSFVSAKLSRQLQLQCEDAIVVLGSYLPQWIDTIVRVFPFLFHFSSRELLFRVTAFHPSRHLVAIYQHLKQSQPQLIQQITSRSGGMPSGIVGDVMRGGGGGGDAASSDDEDDGEQRVRRNALGLGGAGTVELSANRFRTMQDSGEESQTLQAEHRLTQLKVRVQRESVLNAARQLFVSHATARKGTIRAEFHGEEAVGIGPTLEFFTLVSQQLQLKSLHIWNKDTLVTKKPTAALMPSEGKTSEIDENMENEAAAEPQAGAISASAPVDSSDSPMDLDESVSSSAPAPTAAKTETVTSTAVSVSASASSSSKATSKRKRRPSDLPPEIAAAAAISPPSPKLESEAKRAKSSKSAVPSLSLPPSSSHVMLRGSHPLPRLHHTTPARLAEFFDIGVLLCPGCNVLEIPYCETHSQFLTERDQQGHWHCAGELVQPEPSEESKSRSKKASKKSSTKKKKGKKNEEEEGETKEDEPTASSTATTSASSSATPAAASSSSSSSPSQPYRIPCFKSTASMPAICPYCTELFKADLSPSATNATFPTPPRRKLHQWRLHTDEAKYVLGAYPKQTVLLSHIILQCSSCACVNFPGYRASSYGMEDTGTGVLVTNKGGSMVTATNSLIQEKSYRTVTRHCTYICDGLQLQYVPVLLTQRGVIDVIERCSKKSPHMQKQQRGKSEEDEEKEPTSIIRVPSVRSMNQQQQQSSSSSPFITRTDTLLPPALTRTVSTSTTIPATNAFDEPTSQFVTSSSLFPPPTVQHLSDDTTQMPGVLTASLEYHWLVGRFLGQALMEQRLLDLPFSQALLKQLAQQDAQMQRQAFAGSQAFKRGQLEFTVPVVDRQQAPRTLIDSAAAVPPPPFSIILPMTMDLLELSPHLAKPMLKALAICYNRFSSRLFPLPDSLLTIDGASIESFEFDFTLPGHPEIELVPGGADLTVTSANAHLWIWLVAQQSVCQGVIIQMHAIQQGLKQVMDTKRLQIFYPHELEELVSGGGSSGSKLVAWDWSVQKLRSSIKYRQGFSPDSHAIGFLLTIMSEFTPRQQRQFTRFITGSPSLPGGQIAALNPPLTVVKIDIKTKEESSASQHSNAVGGGSGSQASSAVDLSSDDRASATAVAAAVSSNYVLPSVMTCSHYLKLPNYPTIDIMREKLMIAITEGSSGFTLS